MSRVIETNVEPYYGTYSRFYIIGKNDENIKEYIEENYQNQPLLLLETYAWPPRRHVIRFPVVWSEDGNNCAFAKNGILTYALRLDDKKWEANAITPALYFPTFWNRGLVYPRIVLREFPQLSPQEFTRLLGKAHVLIDSRKTVERMKDFWRTMIEEIYKEHIKEIDIYKIRDHSMRAHILFYQKLILTLGKEISSVFYCLDKNFGLVFYHFPNNAKKLRKVIMDLCIRRDICIIPPRVNLELQRVGTIDQKMGETLRRRWNRFSVTPVGRIINQQLLEA